MTTDKHPLLAGPVPRLFCQPPLMILPRLRARQTTLILGSMCLGFLAPPMLEAAPAKDGSEFVNLEKLSDRVTLTYWAGMDRRCNLTAIRGAKGLALIDTEMSPRIMAPIKEQLERSFGRSDWRYVINTHAHDNHAGGNSLFTNAVIVGHENLPEDMQWIIRRQSEPNSKKRELERADQFIQNLRAGLPQVANRSAAEARLVLGEIEFWELHSQDLREGYKVVKPSLCFSTN
jgi:Metallo-beta-lactamase superfamily